MSRGHIATLLRTFQTWDKYKNRSLQDGCFLCQDQVKLDEYKHWYITKNDYPYDAVTSHHHMLVSKEHVNDETKLSKEARMELYRIIWELESKSFYDSILRNFQAAQSHPTHLHYHLLRYQRVCYTN